MTVEILSSESLSMDMVTFFMKSSITDGERSKKMSEKVYISGLYTGYASLVSCMRVLIVK